ncbi:MAG: DUF669 domain-containing protein [Candidatus Limiplasma sp.]|nr:DUF669 domain-containing protein [Candidatus Limiplasma sp.]
MAENLERELGWDDVIEHDSTFVVLPKGEYWFTVKSFERGRYDPSPSAKLPPCNMATLTLEVTDGAQTATLTHRLFLHSRTEGMLCEFFVAIGQRQHGEPLKMNWPGVPGSRGRCLVDIREWTSNKTGEIMKGNEVKRFLEYDPAKMTIPAPAPAPTAGFTQGQF